MLATAACLHHVGGTVGPNAAESGACEFDNLGSRHRGRALARAVLPLVLQVGCRGIDKCVQEVIWARMQWHVSERAAATRQAAGAGV